MIEALEELHTARTTVHSFRAWRALLDRHAPEEVAKIRAVLDTDPTMSLADAERIYALAWIFWRWPVEQGECKWAFY